MDQATGSGIALEFELMKQQKYRGYISNIDKALKNFEYSSEWADLISALGKLNKVISSYPQYDIIPRRIKISKRLAQCMHPNLPSGVHLKALETYDIIFHNAGVERLASELFIYSAGLFPLFGYAAMNVRPTLLGIYEKYFVPLGERLRPALSGFLSGVLPGLEVGMDHYKRTNMLLEQVCAAVSPTYYYTCIWEIVTTNSSIRLPAISYVLDHFSRKLTMEDQRYLLGENIDLTVSALCACLNDAVILVQRNTLEFLLIGFPMHASLLSINDMIKLVTNGLNTILRRDMSLNRRLYSWLLGTETKKNLMNTTQSHDSQAASIDYFTQYAKEILIKAFKSTLKYSLIANPVDLRPYKILISLLDKVEIGPMILDDVLCDVIRTMYLSKGNSEVQKQANLLFSTFDACYVWDFMTNLYGRTCIDATVTKQNCSEHLSRASKPLTIEVDSGPPTLKELSKLTEFLLETVSLEMYNETTRVYLPRVLLAITKMLTLYAENLTDDEIAASLYLMQKIVSRVQPMVTSPPNKTIEVNGDSSKGKSSSDEAAPVEKPLEKSKSDSKLNQTSLEDETALKKSSSGFNMARRSPKKTKKSKSYSKLSELDKEVVCTDTGQLQANSSSTPNLDKTSPNKDVAETEAVVNEEPDKPPMSLPEYSILEKCIKQYEIFYQIYVSNKIFTGEISAREQKCGVTVRVFNAQQSIDKSRFTNEDVVDDENPYRTEVINAAFSTLELNIPCRTSKLRDLLNSCIKEAGTDTLLSGEQKPSRKRHVRGKSVSEKIKIFNALDHQMIISHLINMKMSEPLKEAVKLASCLLVDMSLFPNYNQDLVYDFSGIEIEPPVWLKVLTVVACYCSCDKETQLSVISTLFEVISLLKPPQKHSNTPGVTSVIMLPLMEIGHLNYLEQKTRAFHILTNTLWEYLGDIRLDNAQISNLLYQIHNCLPSGLVEQVIGNRLANAHLLWSTPMLETLMQSGNSTGNEKLLEYSQSRLQDVLMCKPIIPSNVQEYDRQLSEKQGDGFRKFELLWQLTPASQQEPDVGFEKTLMKMFDALSLNAPIRSVVVKWLQDSFLRGDITSLMKPLLKILLSLQTKRVSLIHAVAMRKGEGNGEVFTVSEKDGGVLDCKSSSEYEVLGDKDFFAVSAVDDSALGVKYRTEAISGKKKSPRAFTKIFGVPIIPKGNFVKSPGFGSDKKSPMTPIPTTSASSNRSSSKVPEDDPNMSLIVNPLENSSDFDSVDVDEYVSLSSSAPTQSPGYLDQSTGEMSRKNVNLEYSVSSSDSEISDTEGPEPYSSLPTFANQTNNGTVKRYSGHCEKVDEKLRVYDKIKNRKTYKLKKDDVIKDDGDDKSLTEMSIRIRQAETGAESSSREPSLTSSIRDEGIESLTKESDLKAISDPDFKASEQKRLSCSSKQSTDSNNSSSAYSSSNRVEGRASSVDPVIDRGSLLPNEDNNGEDSPKLSSLDDELLNMTPKTKLSALKSKTPELRRKKVINTDMNWEKTKEKFEKSKLNLEILRQNILEENMKLEKIDPYHTHILLYFGSYDTKQVFYAFNTLRNIISVDTRMFLWMSLTTSISTPVRQLLEKHRKCIDGKDINDSTKKSANGTQYSYRGCMYFEAFVTICLYYCRSYFQRDVTSNQTDARYKYKTDVPTAEEVSDNFKVQIASIELLTLLLNELIVVVKEMSKSLSSYIADLLIKCRIPKVVLHSVLSSVNLLTNNRATKNFPTQFIMNDTNGDMLYAESIQLQLLKLLTSVIKLEFEVRSQINEDAFKEMNSGSPTRLLVNIPTNAKYLQNYTIPQQPMFMAALISALQSDYLRGLHKNWTSLITTCLNCYTGGSLTNIVINVVHQLCNNIDKLVQKPIQIPVDYGASQMEALTTLTHFCLLDNSQQMSLSHVFSSQSSYTQSISLASGQILNNLFNVFIASSSSSISYLNSGQNKANSHQVAAKNAVLSHLPRIIGSAAGLWEHEIGQSRQVKQQLFEFLNPICLHHGTNFLTALAVAWYERAEQNKRESGAETPKGDRRGSDGLPIVIQKYLPQACAEQLMLVKLVAGIRAMQIDLFIRTLHDIIKSPPTIYNPPTGLNLEVSGLEMFYFYMSDASATQLPDAWPALLSLLRDGINSQPPVLFTLLSILNVYVQRCPQMPFNDRKDLRDLHDITSKLVDAISIIAGACLEQTTWLRRNLAVKEEATDSNTNKEGVQGTVNQQYSVQAQSILACQLAQLLDVAYGSQEKDKVVTLITTLMYNIVPYLKNHTTRNIPSFYACSNLLANLSSYQNTRKAWRKDVLDLLTDSAFFQMDGSCLPFWKTILDNLMTYDNMTAFRDLMNRVSLNQTGGLSIFSSKEQEYEQRAMLLKRLAFVIFCSEFDQYHKYMPEIQEQLANSLRLPQMVPSVQAAVFLCFRVLLLRLSPDHVTSLWPIIIAEMVQVFLAIEQELMTDTEEFNQHIRMLSALDTQWVTNSNNGLQSHGHPHWRMVQLETAKLLELGCVLPAVNLPHFQMYRWAFVRSQYDWGNGNGMINGDSHHMQTNSTQQVFIPHVTRIAQLMDLRYVSHSPIQTQQKGHHLVLTCQSISNLQELYGFFSTLSVRWPTHNVLGDTEKEVKVILDEVEHILANDFLESLPGSTTSVNK
ncbi:protein dopey-1 homolog [Culicoides brevitarsis]|uniref:protein dopey-1 homolog n=1 Tax=Culicoides brevitarsis TaxID=469753 RepID=UPI00307BD690